MNDSDLMKVFDEHLDEKPTETSFDNLLNDLRREQRKMTNTIDELKIEAISYKLQLNELDYLRSKNKKLTNEVKQLKQQLAKCNPPSSENIELIAVEEESNQVVVEEQPNQVEVELVNLESDSSQK